MRWLLCIFLGGLVLTACARRKTAAPFDTSPRVTRPIITDTNDTLTISPGASLLGKISSFNAAGRFAVITFPVGKMPAHGQLLNVYRGALKVAEIKITGPARDINTVGDIVAGEVKVGDAVRVN
jgi:hypothetical protein